MNQDVPTRSRALTENHLGYAFTLREIDQRIGNSTGFQLNYLRPKFLSKANVLLQRCMIRRLDETGFLPGVST